MSCKVLLVSLVVAFIFAVIVSAGDKGEGGGHIVLQSPGSKLVMGGGGKKGGHNIILTEGCDKCKYNQSLDYMNRVVLALSKPIESQ